MEAGLFCPDPQGQGCPVERGGAVLPKCGRPTAVRAVVVPDLFGSRLGFGVEAAKEMEGFVFCGGGASRRWEAHCEAKEDALVQDQADCSGVLGGAADGTAKNSPYVGDARGQVVSTSENSAVSLREGRKRPSRPVGFGGFGSSSVRLDYAAPRDRMCLEQSLAVALDPTDALVEGPNCADVVGDSELVYESGGGFFREEDVTADCERYQLKGKDRDVVAICRSINLSNEACLSGGESANASFQRNLSDRQVEDMVEVSSSEKIVPAWKTRNCCSSGPDRRDKLLGTTSALEKALMKFADREFDYLIDPCIGTEFDDAEEAFEYYNLFSWERGFGIRFGKKRYSDTRNSRKLPLEQRYQLGQEFNCSCAGRPSKDLKTSSNRTNCQAKLRLGRTSDHGWIVVEHIGEHNHALSESYGENRLWPSHNHLDKYTKDLIRKLRENNVPITKLYSILGSFFGKMENVPTTKRCLKNLCQKINREESQGDIKKTLHLFSEIMKDDPGFMYSIDPDEDGRIKTLMWTNTRSRMQYEHFGDAITFDTTYKTNLYDMPFGLFVGVNNHFQSVLLGGVLMTDESIDSFRWIFKEFARLMGRKEPLTVLTDQCRAMEVAILEEWKNTTHRWCKWHVLKRVAECLGVNYSADRDFRDKFHKMLNEMLTIEEFVKQWGELMKEYGLEENTFLKQIFETREKWAKCYFKGVFCARMSSTQRSESANMMLKNLVTPNSTLHKFVEQYNKLQFIRDQEEDYQEKCAKKVPKNRWEGGPLVAHAREIYTPTVFNHFLETKDKSEFYFATEVIRGSEYVVEHYDLERIQRWWKGRYSVAVNENGSGFECDCGMFEHFGITCSHILRVLITKGLQKIPDCLIMQRWTKKARILLPGHLGCYTTANPALRAQTFRHSSLMISALEFIEMGDRNVDSYKIGMHFLDEGKRAMKAANAESDGNGLAEQLLNEAADPVVDCDDPFPLRAPKRKKERGRPSTKRDKPGHEVGSKRPRYCSVCRSPYHNKSKCPNKGVGTEQQRKPPTCSRCGLEGHRSTNCVVSAQQLVACNDLLV